MKFKQFLYKQKVINEIENINKCIILNDFQMELFEIFLNEKTNVKVNTNIIKIAIKFLTKKFGLKEEDFTYIGFTDLSLIKKGAKLLQFNIINPNHKSYKSTVAFKYGL